MESIKHQGNKERLYNFYTGSGKAKSGIPLPGVERRLRPQNIVQSDTRDVLRGVDVNMLPCGFFFAIFA